MSNYATLTKVLFLSGFNTNKKKGNQKSAFLMVGIFGLIFLALSFIYNFIYFTSLTGTYGFVSRETYLVIVLATGSLLTFILSIFQMQNTLFKTKDFELLESLPIKKTTIVASRISAVYLMNLYEDLLIILPAVIIYWVYGGSFKIGALTLIASIFVSFIPLLISSLIGSIVATTTARVKNNTFITMFMYIIFLGAIFFFSFSMSSSNGQSLAGILNIMPWFKLVDLSYSYSSKWYLYLLFLGINLLSAIIVILFITLIYRPINSRIVSQNRHEEYKSNNNETNLDLNKLLFKKEWNMLLKKPMYFINSCTGSLIYLVLGIGISIFTIVQKNNGQFDTNESFMSFVIVMASTGMGMGLFMNSIANPASASISLEGSNFEMLKAYPIDSMDIIKSKIKIALITTLPTVFVGGVILTIFFSILKGFDITYLFNFILIPMLANLYSIYCGMLCGLRWAKIDFENEMQVVKNGACANFTMLFSSLAAIIIGIVEIALFAASYASGLTFLKYIGSLAAILLYLLFIFIFKTSIKNNGRRMFDKVLTK